MPTTPSRLALLAAVMTFGATGLALALMGAGLSYLVAAILAAVAAALVQYAALRAVLAPAVPAPASAPVPDTAVVARLEQELADHRAHTAALRHDLRGVLSPALMVSDRLINHAEPTVQRAGQAIVRSVERATSLLAESRSVSVTKDQAP